jgi:hypothetical protein
MPDPVTWEIEVSGLKGRIGYVVQMLESLAGIVSRLNVETHLDTTPDRLSGEQRERAFSDIDTELGSMREILQAWLKQWETEEPHD